MQVNHNQHVATRRDGKSRAGRVKASQAESNPVKPLKSKSDAAREEWRKGERWGGITTKQLVVYAFGRGVWRDFPSLEIRALAPGSRGWQMITLINERICPLHLKAAIPRLRDRTPQDSSQSPDSCSWASADRRSIGFQPGLKVRRSNTIPRGQVVGRLKPVTDRRSGRLANRGGANPVALLFLGWKVRVTT